MNRYNPHGIISLILVSVALIIGIVFTVMQNIWLGLILITIFILFFIYVPKQVCSKCPMREKCGHLAMGKISVFLSSYNHAKFDLKDLLILLTTMIPLIVVPQYFLFSKPQFLILFWVLLVISTIDILLFVCPNCNNIKCPLNKNFKRGA